MTRDPAEAVEGSAPSVKRELIELRPRCQLENIAADIPAELRGVDDLLTRYGRWAVTSGRGGRPPTLDREFDIASDRHESLASWMERCSRVPRDVLMPTSQAMLVQRTLAQLPDKERIVLAVLYVPKRMPQAAQLQILKIAPEHSRRLHVSGLRRFKGYLEMGVR